MSEANANTIGFALLLASGSLLCHFSFTLSPYYTLCMKKAYVFAGLLLGLQAATVAGPRMKSEGPTGIQARATALTRSIAEKARLDEGQYLRVKQLNIRMLTEMEDIKTRFAADPSILDQRLADTQARYEADLTSLLRPAQLAIYQQDRSSMTALGSDPR